MKSKLFMFSLLVVLGMPMSVVWGETVSGDSRSLLPQGDGEILFQDDFSDPNSGWYTYSNDTGSASYGNGDFVMSLMEN